MKKRSLILLAIIVAKFVLQYLLISPAYDLQRDEYLHLDLANHLAWGYISVPPVTSWLSYLIRLLGNGVFWVKFFPALFGALTIVIVWKIIEELRGNLFALVLGSLAILLSVILRINILFQPNSLDIFFWTLTYFTLIKYYNTQEARWIYMCGLAVAFGILSKYNIIFLIAGLLPALLLTPQRKIFFSKHLYISMGIALVIILPNIMWQVRNDFPTIRQLQELARTQLVNVHRLDFVKEQFVFFLSSLVIIFAAFTALFFYQPFKKFRFIAFSYLFTLSLFIYFKAKAYYAIGLYPVLIAFGSVYLEKISEVGKWRYLRPVLIIIVIALAIPFIRIGFPYTSPEQIALHAQAYKNFGLLRWEDGKDHIIPQDFADMIGWSDLAKNVDSVYSRIDDKDHTLVLCDNYGQAGAINYYSTFKNINAVSLNADYINWIPLKAKINNVILVQDPDDDDTGRVKERPLFDTVYRVGVNENPFSREQGRKVYLLKGAKVDINSLIASDIKKRNIGE
ncbi:MAG: glycosyltransferase family 39 protein [Ginsengibacter sp.]